MKDRYEVIDLAASGRQVHVKYRYGIAKNGVVIACFKDVDAAEEVAWSMTLGHLLSDSVHDDMLDLLFEYFSRLKGLA